MVKKIIDSYFKKRDFQNIEDYTNTETLTRIVEISTLELMITRLRNRMDDKFLATLRRMSIGVLISILLQMLLMTRKNVEHNSRRLPLVEKLRKSY